MELLELKRTGTFAPQNFTIDLSKRCGSPDMQSFEYSVQLWGDARFLDSHGFLVDNGDIDNWFQLRYGNGNQRTLPSCEGMVIDALNGLRYMLSDRTRYACCIRELKVVIGGSNGAFITGQWKMPKWFPAWLVNFESQLFVKLYHN